MRYTLVTDGQTNGALLTGFHLYSLDTKPYKMYP